MVNHSAVWAAIDEMAAVRRMSRSGFAKFCGLDATAFNISKRFEVSGKPHWPAMYTIYKILSATGTSATEFGRMCDEFKSRAQDTE